MSLKLVPLTAAAVTALSLSLASSPALAQGATIVGSQSQVVSGVASATGASTSAVASAINGVLASAAAAGLPTAVVVGAVVTGLGLVAVTVVGTDSAGNTVTTTITTAVPL